MRTIVYVDGFNLYYGAVRGTPYKWLDLRALFTRILRPDNKIPMTPGRTDTTVPSSAPTTAIYARRSAW